MAIFPKNKFKIYRQYLPGLFSSDDFFARASGRGGRRQSTFGFTVIEMLVSISIFLILTTSFLFSYQGFNGRVNLETMAQQIGQWVRDTQVSSMSVRWTASGSKVNGYGLHFALALPTKFEYYADTNGDQTCCTGDVMDREIVLFRGNKIVNLEALNGATWETVNTLDIYFTRPDPDAIITQDNDAVLQYSAGRITVESPNGARRYIRVWITGQISVGSTP